MKGYDYSKPGRYFITICTKEKGNIFGEIVNRTMMLNETGKIIDYIWRDLPNHNDNITLNKYIIMPDHIHGIIMINKSNNNDREGLEPSLSKHNGLFEIIRQFKTFSSKGINIIRNVGEGSKPSRFQWKRSFYDEIIRNEKMYNKIAKYIDNNPNKWKININKAIVNMSSPDCTNYR